MAPRIPKEVEIKEAASRIARAVNPSRIVLFGSHAKGTQRPDSDLDFLVIAESSEPRHRRARGLYKLLRDLPTSIDILYFTPEEVEEWEDVQESIVGTALREGVVLYEDAE